MSCSSLRRSGMAHVNEDHTLTCHPHVHSQVGWLYCLYSQPQSITAIKLLLISRPAECRRMSWPGWFGEILRWFARPKTGTHPSNSRGCRQSNWWPSNREFKALTIRLPSRLYVICAFDIRLHRSIVSFQYNARFLHSSSIFLQSCLLNYNNRVVHCVSKMSTFLFFNNSVKK